MTTRPTLLLVESDQHVVLPVLAALRAQGWEVALAADAPSALATARKLQPAVVVMGTRIPAGGAFITLKRLRAVAATAATPVLLVGEATEAQRQEFLAAGAQACLPAPVTGEAVVAGVRAQLTAPPVVTEAPAEVLQHPLRLAALRASGLLDSPPEAGFERVTRLVTLLLGTPTALFSVIDKDRQLFRGQTGFAEPWASAGQSPLSHSFCQWVVSGREPVTVADAREHPLLRHNLAVRDMGVVAYSGVPVSSVQGEPLGALCAIDARPRTWSPPELATLNDLARLAESCIAHATLVRQPPQRAEDFDRYVEATGAAIGGALGILRRGGASLGEVERGLLHDLIEEFGQHLVQLNRLIQVNQAIA
jgi:GAF domain-containing protein